MDDKEDQVSNQIKLCSSPTLCYNNQRASGFISNANFISKLPISFQHCDTNVINRSPSRWETETRHKCTGHTGLSCKFVIPKFINHHPKLCSFQSSADLLNLYWQMSGIVRFASISNGDKTKVSLKNWLQDMDNKARDKGMNIKNHVICGNPFRMKWSLQGRQLSQHWPMSGWRATSTTTPLRSCSCSASSSAPAAAKGW